MTTPQSPLGDLPRDDDHLVDVDHPVDPAQQERVRSLLAGLPDPGPMPADLVARIQARLDEESRTLHGSPHGSHAGVVDLAERRRRGRRTGLLAAAGVVAVAGVAGVALTQGLGPLDPGGSMAVLDPGRSASVTGAPASTGLPDRQLRLSPAKVTRGTLAAEGAQLLSRRFDPAFPLQAESPAAGPLATPRGLEDCLSSVGLQDARTVSGELAGYEGRPALILGVVRSDGAREAWVLDRSCERLVDPQPLP